MGFLQRWKALLIATVALILLVLVLAGLGLAFADPWRPILDEARRRGVPTSLADLARHRDPERLAAAQRLLALQTAITLYRSGWPPWQHPAGPTPPEVAAVWARNDPVVIAQALEACDRLADPTPSPHPQGFDPEDHRLRTASSFAASLLAQHWLVQEPEPADAAALRLVRRYPAAIGAASLPTMTLLRALLARIERVHDPAIAVALRALADRLPDEERAHARSLFAFAAETVRDYPGLAARVGFSAPRWRMTVACRLGGASLLREELAWVAFLDATDDPIAIAREASRVIAAREARTSLRGWARTVIAIADPVAIPSWPFAAMLARLIAWRIDGHAWPIDLFDPARRPLRRIERDGTLIAAYSVALDGSDDGGKRGRDWVFPLLPVECGGPP